MIDSSMNEKDTLHTITLNDRSKKYKLFTLTKFVIEKTTNNPKILPNTKEWTVIDTSLLSNTSHLSMKYYCLIKMIMYVHIISSQNIIKARTLSLQTISIQVQKRST